MGHVQFWFESGSVGRRGVVVVAAAAAAADPSAVSSAELLPFESPTKIW